MEQYILEKENVSMEELCEEFDMSMNTVRMDVAELVKKGSVKKVYGGVCSNRQNSLVPFEERKNVNYDSPEALEVDLLIEHLTALREGKTIESPVYNYKEHNRSKDKTMVIEPKKVMILEGILALENPKLRELMDIKIFVEADADERILRRVIRDVKERGRDVEDIARQYLTTVKPMHYIYVEPTKSMADIVINSGMNDVAFELIKTKIEQML